MKSMIDERNKRAEEPSQALLQGFVARLGADTLRYLPAAILPAAFSVTAVAVFTRIFGPASYGYYAIVLAFTTLIAAIAAGWIQQGVLRFLPRYLQEDRRREFLAKLGALLSAVGVVCVTLTLAGLPASRFLGEQARFYLPAAGVVLGEAVFLSINTVYQASLKSGAYAIHRILAYGLRLVLSLAFVYLVRRDVVGLVVGSALAYAVLLPPMIARLGLPSPLATVRSFDSAFVRSFAAYGLPMIGWMLGGQLLGIADRFVIGAFRDSAEVGIYSANYTLVAMALSLLSTPFVMAAHPIIMTVWERKRDTDITRVISVFSRYYLMTIVPFVTAVTVYSREITGLCLGPEFREGHVIVPFVLIGTAVWGLSMYGHKTLELLERTRSMLFMVLVSAGLNILLNVIFVPRFGYRAAAVTTLVSYVSYPVFVWFVARRTLPWRIPWSTVIRTIAAAVAMAAVMMWVRATVAIPLYAAVVAGTLAGLMAYLAGLVVVGEMKMPRFGRSRPGGVS